MQRHADMDMAPASSATVTSVPIGLLCYVSGSSEWGCFASLDLDKDVALWVLSLRPAVAAAIAAMPDMPDCLDGFKELRAWDARITCESDPSRDIAFDDDALQGWCPTPAGLTFKRLVKATEQQIVANSKGVRWFAWVNDMAIETALITWPQLEAVARGADPFAELGERECLACGQTVTQANDGAWVDASGACGCGDGEHFVG